MQKTVSLLLLFWGLQLHAQDFVSINPEANSNYFSIGDFDNDGDMDMYGFESFPNSPATTYWYRNQGGSPIVFEEIMITLNADVVGEPEAGDYDGDGDTDVLFAKEDNLDIFVLQNNGSGVFQEKYLNTNGASGFAFHDLEGDGDTDFIGIDPNGGFLFVYINNGDQAYIKKNIVNYDSPKIGWFDAADLDNDGDIDIVAAYETFLPDLNLELYKNDGSNNFSGSVLAANEVNKLRAVTIGDVNKDGKLDICVANNEGVRGWINGGSLGFTAQQLVVYPTFTNLAFRSLSLPDINGDEVPDIVVGDHNGPTLWYKNTGTSPLAYEKREVGLLQSTSLIEHADFDLDGDEDLLVSDGFTTWYYENIVEQVSGVNENPQTVVFEVYPNPASDIVNITDLPPSTYKFEVFDRKGTMQIAGVLLGEKIDIATLPKGIYFLTMTDQQSGISFVSEFVKQ